jgi:hypothetical protein
LHRHSAALLNSGGGWSFCNGPGERDVSWKINNSKQKVSGDMQDAEKTQFNAWGKKVAGGSDPKSAASSWDSDYEVLNKAKISVTDDKKKKTVHDAKCCSIRLSKGNRVYFMQIDDLQLCVVLKAGDHKEPTWLKEI